MGREARRSRPRGESARSLLPPGMESDQVTIRRESPWGKMSEKLKAVAEPWTSRLGDDPSLSDMTAIYKTTSLIWNASRLPDPTEREKTLSEIRRLMTKALPDLPPAPLEQLIQDMHQRASEQYSDDPRIVARISVEQRGPCNFHVSAASMEIK
jgi:hypothetical protein